MTENATELNATNLPLNRTDSLFHLSKKLSLIAAIIAAANVLIRFVIILFVPNVLEHDGEAVIQISMVSTILSVISATLIILFSVYNHSRQKRIAFEIILFIILGVILPLVSRTYNLVESFMIAKNMDTMATMQLAYTKRILGYVSLFTGYSRPLTFVVCGINFVYKRNSRMESTRIGLIIYAASFALFLLLTICQKSIFPLYMLSDDLISAGPSLVIPYTDIAVYLCSILITVFLMSKKSKTGLVIILCIILTAVIPILSTIMSDLELVKYVESYGSDVLPKYLVLGGSSSLLLFMPNGISGIFIYTGVGMSIARNISK